jgi:undecaprenyl diphosphate synthase
MTLRPQHIAIIMDGNGRWAQRRLLPRIAGHNRGVEASRVIVQHCVEQKIPILTLFAFSSENWQRPATEVKLLMSLLQKLLMEEVQQLNTNNVKLRVIGELQTLAPALQQAIERAEILTVHNTGLQLNIALNYGGRWDIVQATRAIVAKVAAGALNSADIDESIMAAHMMLHDLPEPDLLIRTSGEQRISNFLLWQLAYTEIYFTNVLWPDFAVPDMQQALEFFASRERRYGLITDPAEQTEHV